MHNSRLIQILNKFDKREIKRLSKFIHSPYFLDLSRNKDVILLFEYLYERFPFTKNVSLDRELIYSHVYEQKAFSKSKWDKLVWRLLKVVKQFISVEFDPAQQDEVERLLHQAKFFRIKQLENLYQLTFKQIDEQLQVSTFEHKSNYFLQFKVEEERATYLSIYNNRKEDINLPFTLDRLDSYYLLARLEYACLLLNQGDSFRSPRIEEQLELGDKIYDVFGLDYFSANPQLQLYFQAYLLLRTQKEAPFQALSQLIDQYEEQIPFQQLQFFGAMCRNYRITQANFGERESILAAFELYKKHLNKGYLYHQDGILPGNLRNLVVLGLKVQAYDWVFQFLQGHKDRVTGSAHPKAVIDFNLAHYYFAIQAYDKALESLADTFEDYYYKIAAKRLELKIYYEQKSILLESKLDAFKMFIFRLSKTWLPDVPRQGNTNFINMLKQILHPATQGNAERIDRLIQKIKDKKIFVERDWLISKLEELV